MDIFDRIRTKASQAFTGVANTLDRDKNLPGFQIAPGGVSGGVDRVKQNFQQNPQQYNVINQMAQGNIKSGVKPLDFLGQTAAKPLDFLSNTFLYNQDQNRLFPNSPVYDFAELNQQPDYQAFTRGEIKYADLTPETRQKMFDANFNVIGEVALSDPKAIVDEATSPIKNADILPTNKPNTTKNLFDDTFRSAKGVIEGFGDTGKRIVNTLNKAEEEGALFAGNQLNELNRVVKNLSDVEKQSLADVIEGNKKPVSETQSIAVDTWRSIADDIQKRATDAGLDVGYLENYFPRHILKDGDSFAGSIQRGAPRRFGNLELTRQSDLPYDKDPSVLFDYIERANKRIADTLNFGAKDEVLYDMANKITQEGGDSQQVVKYLDQILGKNQPTAFDKASETIRGVQSVSKLGFTSPITNLTQNISTLTRTDPDSMARALHKTLTNFDEAYETAVKVDEVTPGLKRVFEDYTGNKQYVSKWLNKIGFSQAEDFNRIIAVNAGLDYTDKLIRQAGEGSESAIRELQRLGFDTTDLGKIDPLLGARRISQETQFSTKPGELPYGWNTSIGKVLTQFKSFAYKQTGFMKDQAVRVASEASQGNFKPLTNALIAYGVAAPVVGEVVNDLKAIINNKEREDTDTLSERYISNILAASSFGLLDSTGALFGQYGPGGVTSTLLGPTAGDAIKFGEVVSGVTGDKYDRRKALRSVLKTIPGVGRTISNTVVPNSYVDNIDLFGQNLGVNEGLNESDKQTYNTIKERDPQAAQLFKNKQQANREEPSFLQRLFTGNTQVSVPSKNASKEERQAFERQMGDLLDNGITPTNEELSTYFFDGQTANTNSIKERSDVFKQLSKAFDDEYYTNEQKRSILKASGASEKDLQYYQLTELSQDERLQELLPRLEQMNYDELTSFLMQGKRSIGGREMISNNMVDYLYENDLIDENQKEAIKNLRYDEIKDKFYFTKSFQEKGQPKTMSYSQALSKYKIKLPTFDFLKDVDNFFAIANRAQSQINGSGDRLLTEILNYQG